LSRSVHMQVAAPMEPSNQHQPLRPAVVAVRLFQQRTAHPPPGASARPSRRAHRWYRPAPGRLTQRSLTHTTRTQLIKWAKGKQPNTAVLVFLNESRYDYILNPFIRRTVCSWLHSLLFCALVDDTTSLRYSSLVPSCIYCLHVTRHGAVTFVTVIVTVHK